MGILGKRKVTTRRFRCNSGLSVQILDYLDMGILGSPSEEMGGIIMHKKNTNRNLYKMLAFLFASPLPLIFSLPLLLKHLSTFIKSYFTLSYLLVYKVL